MSKYKYYVVTDCECKEGFYQHSIAFEHLEDAYGFKDRCTENHNHEKTFRVVEMKDG